MDNARYDQIGVNLASLLSEEEVFWHQKSKVFWLRDGYVNSKFFHASATARKEKNKIKKHCDDSGVYFENSNNLC